MKNTFLMLGVVCGLAGCGHKSTPPQASAQRPQPVQQATSQYPDVYPQPEPTPSQPPAVAAAEPAKRELPVSIPAGTSVRVRLEQTIDTRRNRAGDRFEATLTTPIRVSGELLIPRGTVFHGHVTEAKPSGRFKGRAELGVALDSFQLNRVTYRIATAPDIRASGRHRRRNWTLIGGGSGAGAAIGAIAGGGAGALIGAGAGAGAGVAGAFFTGRKNVSLPVESLLSFRLRKAVSLSGPGQEG